MHVSAAGYYEKMHNMQVAFFIFGEMKPQPVEETASMLVRGIERRSRTIATPATRLALFVPDVFQLVVEGMARRHGWAAAIREQEQADGGKDT